MLEKKRVGLIGARSFVGERLTQLLEKKGYQVLSFSRQGDMTSTSLYAPVDEELGEIRSWICLAPVWTLPEHLQLLLEYRVDRLVALSSTSRFTKIDSPSSSDRETARRLREGEEEILQWARVKGVEAVILQPTLIYGHGKDKNVSQIAAFIRRFGFFPLLGKGKGLRQPVHVDDVAQACCSALEKTGGAQKTYVLSGGDVLSYREMVERIFKALEKKPRFIRCPIFFFSLAVRLAQFISFKGISTEMAVRMNNDQHFDFNKAAVDFGFRPRAFHPKPSDCYELSDDLRTE